MNRRAIIAIAAGVLVTVLVVLGVREAGSVVRRPEGAAERFLTAASRRSAKDRAKAAHFGDPDIARAITRFTRKDRNDDFFGRIAVGRATPTLVAPGSVRVAFRVVRNDADSSVDENVLVLRHEPGPSPRAWRVTGFEPCCSDIELPKHGSAPASVGIGVWLLALGFGAAFTVGSEALLRALGAEPRPRPPSRR